MNALKTIIVQLISGDFVTGILITLFIVILISYIKEYLEWKHKSKK